MNAIDTIKQANDLRNKALAALHSELGYASPQALVAAINAAAAPAAPATQKRGPRPTTNRNGIEKALRTGTETMNAIAAEFGVSVQTVYLIKKSLGLVKPQARRK